MHWNCYHLQSVVRNVACLCTISDIFSDRSYNDLINYYLIVNNKITCQQFNFYILLKINHFIHVDIISFRNFGLHNYILYCIFHLYIYQENLCIIIQLIKINMKVSLTGCVQLKLPVD